MLTWPPRGYCCLLYRPYLGDFVGVFSKMCNSASIVLSNSVLAVKAMWREWISPTSMFNAQSAQTTRRGLSSSAGSAWSHGKAQLHAQTAATTRAAWIKISSSSSTAKPSRSLRWGGLTTVPPLGPVPPAAWGWSTTMQAANTSSVLAVVWSSALCVWS